MGRYLERAFRDSEVGLSAVEVTACFRTERRARATLEEMHARFHQQLATLPTARFEGKRGRLTLPYASGQRPAEDVLKNRVVDAGLFRRALEELVEVVRTLGPELGGKQKAESRRRKAESRWGRDGGLEAVGTAVCPLSRTQRCTFGLCCSAR